MQKRWKEDCFGQKRNMFPFCSLTCCQSSPKTASKELRDLAEDNQKSQWQEDFRSSARALNDHSEDRSFQVESAK